MSENTEDNGVYLTLNLRGTPGSFHWGIIVISKSPSGKFYHATNRSGGWQREVKDSSDPSKSVSLVLLYKVGTVSSSTAGLCDSTLRSVPADGTPSARTGEAFDCRIWVKDAIVKLHEAGVIKLVKSIEAIEEDAKRRAEKLESGVERGRAKAGVVNQPGSSTSS